MKLLPKLLRAFEHITDEGGPVDRAFAIRDAGLKDPDEIERKMLEILENRTFIFPKGIAVHAIPGETETWLLADISSIKTVAAARGVHLTESRTWPGNLRHSLIQKPCSRTY